MPHPYKEHEGTAAWSALDREIAALEKNRELTLTTAREYVIGALCDRLAKEGITKSGKRPPAA